MIVDFIYERSRCTIGKRKDGHSSSQTMASSSSFAALAKTKAALSLLGKRNVKIKN